ncbi:GDP-L-fucose synthase 1 [[Clostridium] sordellii ATCC 9714]|nr:GDP-L-fucose synthase 1 [[Clostridium] sordellii ATCC 9714] [Paeniclostridium sordellii ATCC 9714]
MNKDSKIYVAGHRGLVGSAIVRNLQDKGFTNIIHRTHEELDLTNQKSVRTFFETERPDYVFLAAAKVGGIHANNTYPADFIYDNLMIQNNIIKASHDFGVKKLLFLGSTCIYPKMAPQPIKEEYLLTGALEETNEAYAVAKIAGLEMCKFFKKQYETTL